MTIRKLCSFISLAFISGINDTTGFMQSPLTTLTNHLSRQNKPFSWYRSHNRRIGMVNFPDYNEKTDAIITPWTRRDLFEGIGQASMLICASTLSFSAPASSASNNDEDVLTVLKTSSGLKYIDLVPGTGTSPQYGNYCSIQYTAYIKLAKTPNNPNPQPQQYDKMNEYLVKHGNGRMIPGLDEGLHTMKVGGVRRIIIPPKLGYIDIGLGPIPEYPWQRKKLNDLLDEMVAIGAGTLIFEVKLLSVVEDEADQGYYQDDSLSPEDFATLRENLRIKGLQERASQANTSS